nr:regulatory protein RecX [Arthrobacter mobilis]
MRPERGRSAGPTPGTPADLTPEADPYEVARAIVLRQLTVAPKSRRQLELKLAERGVPGEVAAAVLDRFEEVELIDDAEFARMWVSSRARTRSLARSALRRELAEKGVGPEESEAALEQLSDEDEVAAARELVRRKLGAGRVPADRGEREKAVRRLASMLARKGYPPALAFKVVSEELGHAAGETDTP